MMNPATTTTHNDTSYGQAAVSLGFISEAQVAECVQIQTKMREMGVDEPLGEILAKKGYISAQHHTNVLKKLGVQTSPIPGYTLLGKIGQGGMGTVYKAIQTSVNRTVAIKIMSPAATKDKTYVARFLQEAQSAAQLNHKNLITAIDVGVANGLYYFVMEFVTGKSCRDIMNSKGAFDEKTALDVAIQMAAVLDHIHQHTMVHRDIKPENMILTTEGVVKLCDLGLAKSTSTIEQSLTQDGLAVGTPYFMSPEQIRGDKDVDIRADLYSLGATLYYMVTGKHPYEGKSAAETMSLHLNQPVPETRKHAPQLREDFAWLIHKLMAKDRAHRYQTPAELLEDLRRVQSGSAAQLARQHAARVHLHQKAHGPRHVVKKTVAVWPFVAAGVIVLGLGGGIIYMGQTPPPPESPKIAVAPPPAPKIEAPAGPIDDPKKVGEAAGLFSSADLWMKQEKWADALRDLEKLRTVYASLDFTQKRMAEIGTLAGTCEVKIRFLKGAEVVKVEEARAALREGRWQDAQSRLQDLVKSGHGELQADLDRARQELEAEALFREINTARDEKRWLDVIAKIITLNQQHARTDTAVKHQAEIAILTIRAGDEQTTAKLLADAHAAVVGGNWRNLERLLVDIEKKRDTDTYHKKEAELKDLRQKLYKANEAKAEENASQAWIATLKSYNENTQDKDYDQATESLRSFIQVHGATQVAKSKDAEINTKIADLQKRRTKDRDDEAKKVWAAVQKDYKSMNFDAAGDGIARLIELSDTATYRSYERTIKQYKQTCDQQAKVSGTMIVELGFEDLPGLWTFSNPCLAGNTGDEPFQGKRSARLSISPSSQVWHPIKGITGKAETITFYARSKNLKAQSVGVEFFVWEQGMMSANWSTDFTFTAEWRPYTIRLTDMKPQNDTARSKKSIDVGRINAFGFSPSDDVTIDFQIDTFRVEAGKGK